MYVPVALCECVIELIGLARVGCCGTEFLTGFSIGLNPGGTDEFVV